MKGCRCFWRRKLQFDETGDRLSPSHAYNHGKRYRYYISHRLLKNRDNKTQGWRIAAAEIERIVLQQALEILRDRPKIAQWIGSHATMDQIDRGLQATSELDRMLPTEHGVESQKQILQTLFGNITLSPESIRFVVRKRSLVHGTIFSVDSISNEQGSDATRDSDEDVS